MCFTFLFSCINFLDAVKYYRYDDQYGEMNMEIIGKELIMKASLIPAYPWQNWDLHLGSSGSREN